MAFDAINGVFFVITPFIIQNRLPADTSHFTEDADLASIPALRNIVAIHPIISAISIIDSQVLLPI